ncbi:MAG: hypothetical protein LBD60_00890 [Puniceicoccales bacterium]|jgi:hypothetical protein|nr:hypothetical protein [Puniceicoccales bacterium]
MEVKMRCSDTIDAKTKEGQVLRAIAGEKIPNDPNGDTWYLQAVRMGDLENVRRYLSNLHLNLNAVDNNGDRYC